MTGSFARGSMLLASAAAALLTGCAIFGLRKVLSPKTTSLENKWVLITGCDSGLGKLSAEALIKQYSLSGLKVICLCLTEAAAQAVINFGASAAFSGDVTNFAHFQDNIVPKVVELCGGKLWSVVHVAGIANYGSFEYLLVEDFKKILEVNFFSIVHMNQLLYPFLKRAKGRIVLVSSVCGLVSSPYNAPYNSAKHALEGYGRSMRVEAHKAGVQVVFINPGTMRTAMSENFIPGFKKLHYERYLANPTSPCFEELSLEWAEAYAKKTAPGIEQMMEDPNHVVTDIVHAVTAVQPKHRYLSGGAAKTLWYTLWSLPEMWSHDLMYRLSYGSAPPSI